MSSSIKLKNANGKTVSVTNSNANQTDKEVIYLNTVDELANASGSINAVAIVSDLSRGGTFEWSATGTANGGTVFAGVSGYWNRQYSGAVNVKWFGAKGDGIEDDTTAIQNAIDSGNNVIIGDGDVFNITSQLNISNSNWSISGKGKIITSTNITYFFNISNVYNIKIEGITLESTYPENTTCAIYSGSNIYMSNSIINGVTIRGTQLGISLNGKHNSFNDENFTLGAYTTNLSYKDNDTDFDAKNTITNCVIENSLTSTPAGTGGSPAIYMRGNFWNCSNNRIRNWYGPGILAGNDSIIKGNTIINMVRENGIYLPGVKRTTVVGNHIENVRTDCIAFNNSENCTATGNVLISNGNGLFRCQDGSKSIIIANNIGTIPTSSTTFAVRGYQNADKDGYSDISIVNNSFDFKSVIRTQPAIVLPAPNGTYSYEHNNILISGNKFRNLDCSSVPSSYYINTMIYIQGTPFNCTMRDNSFFNTVNYSTGSAYGGKIYFRGFDSYNKNYMRYVDGTVFKTPDNEYVRFSIGSSGAVASVTKNTSSVISSIEKGASTGQYTITFTQPVSVKSLSFHSSGTNEVQGADLTVFNPAIVDDTVTSITITTYNLSSTAVRTPVWVSYNCSIMITLNLISTI